MDGTNKQERVCDRRLPQKDAAASQAAISGGGPPENEKGRRPAHWPAGLERGHEGGRKGDETKDKYRRPNSFCTSSKTSRSFCIHLSSTSRSAVRALGIISVNGCRTVFTSKRRWRTKNDIAVPLTKKKKNDQKYFNRPIHDLTLKESCAISLCNKNKTKTVKGATTPQLAKRWSTTPLRTMPKLRRRE